MSSDKRRVLDLYDYGMDSEEISETLDMDLEDVENIIDTMIVKDVVIRGSNYMTD